MHHLFSGAEFQRVYKHAVERYGNDGTILTLHRADVHKRHRCLLSLPDSLLGAISCYCRDFAWKEGHSSRGNLLEDVFLPRH